MPDMSVCSFTVVGSVCYYCSGPVQVYRYRKEAPVKLTTNIGISFLGATRNVTGSSFLVEANGTKLLVDCGLYQEREFLHRNWDKFPYSPDTLDAVLLTHAHLDHCGLLPKLVSEGFNGPIYCTGATAEISKIILLDSARIHEEDAEFKRNRHRREGRYGPHPVVPLYTIDDATAVLPLFSHVKYGEEIQLSEGIRVEFRDAGHVLGASVVKVRINDNGEERAIVFSGDIGRRDRPILRDPAIFENADYVLIESTYGNRQIPAAHNTTDELAEIVNKTVAAGGNIVIPSFALERAQEVLYCLNELLLENRIPHLMTFVDSPMAISITEVFERFPEYFDEEMRALIRDGNSPFDLPGLKFVRTVNESKAINHVKGSVVIIAGSGMCTGGRIKHHLVSNISRPESTILFVGYQAAGTLGRHIVDGARKVRILGQHYPVRARIARLNGFSAHAGRDQLLKWLTGLKKSPRHVFVVHGEEESARDFADLIRQETGWETSVPAYQDKVILQ